MIKRIVCSCLAVLLVLSLAACGSAVPEETDGEKVLFTDSCGREVEIPADAARIAPSGQAATMMLTALCPEKLVCLGSKIEKNQEKYFMSGLAALPVTGNLYGGKSTLNPEELLSTGAELIIDMGDYKPSVAEDLDALQAQTGLPCIFIEADLAHMAEAFRTLGSILHREERSGEIAALIDATLSMAAENSAGIAEENRISVMYSSGTDPLGTNAAGSSQAQVLDLVGAVNAVKLESVVHKSGGNIINMEQVYNFAPDVLLLGSETAFSEVAAREEWQQLAAVQTGKTYRIPASPYSWMSEPPSMNMIPGVWWLGNLLYPEVYDYDMAAKAKEIYKTLWQYELSDEEIAEMLEYAQ